MLPKGRSFSGVSILEEQAVVFLLAATLMHQAGKKIKERGDFFIFQAGNEGLQEGWFGESLQECREGPFIGLPIQAKADVFCVQVGGLYLAGVHGGFRNFWLKNDRI